MTVGGREACGLLVISRKKATLYLILCDLCVLCVKVLFERRDRRDTQRAAEKTVTFPPVDSFSIVRTG